MIVQSGRSQHPVLDVLGIGFGPANLALAICAQEYNATAPRDRRLGVGFIERQAGFGWHEGMLIEDATMQVSFLKDLATLRNPASAFSFISYLHHENRLVDFINHKTIFPTRVEFHRYFEWAAAHFEHLVEYGTKVIDIRPVLEGDDVVALDVVGVRQNGSGEQVVKRARNVVIGTGITPVMPDGTERSDRVLHSSELLDFLDSGKGREATRIAVIGAGQSAAEVAAFLHDRFPDAEIYAIFERYGYSPADDSPFANQVFDPIAVDEFFNASPAVRQRFYEYHSNTNYSVVDPDLIDELYRRVYSEKVQGRPRLHIMRMSRLAGVEATATGARLRVAMLLEGRTTALDSDFVVCATGYAPMDPSGLMGSVADLYKRDDTGRFRLARDYRILTGSDVKAAVYLQGGTEHTHGISSSLLSNTAVRAGEILASIAGDENHVRA